MTYLKLLTTSIILMLLTGYVSLQDLQKPHFQVDHKAGKLDITASKDAADIVFTNDNIDLLLKPGDTKGTPVVINKEGHAQQVDSRHDVPLNKSDMPLNTTADVQVIKLPNSKVKKKYRTKENLMKNNSLIIDKGKNNQSTGTEDISNVTWKGRLNHTSDEHTANTHVLQTLDEIKSLMTQSFQKELPNNENSTDTQSDTMSRRFGNIDKDFSHDEYLNAANAIIKQVEHQQGTRVSKFNKEKTEDIDYVAKAQEILKKYKQIEKQNNANKAKIINDNNETTGENLINMEKYDITALNNSTDNASEKHHNLSNTSTTVEETSNLVRNDQSGKNVSIIKRKAENMTYGFTKLSNDSINAKQNAKFEESLTKANASHENATQNDNIQDIAETNSPSEKLANNSNIKHDDAHSIETRPESASLIHNNGKNRTGKSPSDEATELSNSITKVQDKHGDGVLKTVEAAEKAYASIDMDVDAVINATKDAKNKANVTEPAKDTKEEEVYATIDNNLTRNITKAELDNSTQTSVSNSSKEEPSKEWKHYVYKADKEHEPKNKHRNHHLRKIVAWAPAKIKPEDGKNKTRKTSRSKRLKYFRKKMLHGKNKGQNMKNREFDGAMHGSQSGTNLKHEKDTKAEEYIQKQNEGEHFGKHNDEEHYLCQAGEDCHKKSEGAKAEEKIKADNKGIEPDKQKTSEEDEVKHKENIENQQTGEDDKITEAALEHAKALANDVARELNETAINSPFQIQSNQDNSSALTEVFSSNTSPDNEPRKLISDTNNKLTPGNIEQPTAKESQKEHEEDTVGSDKDLLHSHQLKWIEENAKKASSEQTSLKNIKAEEADLNPEEKHKFAHDKDWFAESNNTKPHTEMDKATLHKLITTEPNSNITNILDESETRKNSENKNDDLEKNMRMLDEGVSSFLNNRNIRNSKTNLDQIHSESTTNAKENVHHYISAKQSEEEFRQSYQGNHNKFQKEERNHESQKQYNAHELEGMVTLEKQDEEEKESLKKKVKMKNKSTKQKNKVFQKRKNSSIIKKDAKKVIGNKKHVTQKVRQNSLHKKQTTEHKDEKVVQKQKGQLFNQLSSKETEDAEEILKTLDFQTKGLIVNNQRSESAIKSQEVEKSSPHLNQQSSLANSDSPNKTTTTVPIKETFNKIFPTGKGAKQQQATAAKLHSMEQKLKALNTSADKSLSASLTKTKEEEFSFEKVEPPVITDNHLNLNYKQADISAFPGEIRKELLEKDIEPPANPAVATEELKTESKLPHETKQKTNDGEIVSSAKETPVDTKGSKQNLQESADSIRTDQTNKNKQKQNAELEKQNRENQQQTTNRTEHTNNKETGKANQIDANYQKQAESTNQASGNEQNPKQATNLIQQETTSQAKEIEQKEQETSNKAASNELTKESEKPTQHTDTNTNTANALSNDVSKAMEELEALMKEKTEEVNNSAKDNDEYESAGHTQRDIANSKNKLEHQNAENTLKELEDQSKAKPANLNFINPNNIRPLEDDPIKALALFKRNTTEQYEDDETTKNGDGELGYSRNEISDQEKTNVQHIMAPSERNIEHILNEGNNFQLVEENKLNYAKDRDNMEQEHAVEKVLKKYMKASKLLKKRLHEMRKEEDSHKIEEGQTRQLNKSNVNETSEDFYVTGTQKNETSEDFYLKDKNTDETGNEPQGKAFEQRNKGQGMKAEIDQNNETKTDESSYDQALKGNAVQSTQEADNKNETSPEAHGKENQEADNATEIQKDLTVSSSSSDKLSYEQTLEGKSNSKENNKNANGEDEKNTEKAEEHEAYEKLKAANDNHNELSGSAGKEINDTTAVENSKQDEKSGDSPKQVADNKNIESSVSVATGFNEKLKTEDNKQNEISESPTKEPNKTLKATNMKHEKSEAGTHTKHGKAGGETKITDQEVSEVNKEIDKVNAEINKIESEANNMQQRNVTHVNAPLKDNNSMNGEANTMAVEVIDSDNAEEKHGENSTNNDTISSEELKNERQEEKLKEASHNESNTENKEKNEKSGKENEEKQSGKRFQENLEESPSNGNNQKEEDKLNNIEQKLQSENTELKESTKKEEEKPADAAEILKSNNKNVEGNAKEYEMLKENAKMKNNKLKESSSTEEKGIAIASNNPYNQEATLEENQLMIDTDANPNYQEKPSDIVKDIKAEFDQENVVNNELKEYSDKERQDAEKALQEMDRLTQNADDTRNKPIKKLTDSENNEESKNSVKVKTEHQENEEQMEVNKLEGKEQKTDSKEEREQSSSSEKKFENEEEQIPEPIRKMNGEEAKEKLKEFEEKISREKENLKKHVDTGFTLVKEVGKKGSNAQRSDNANDTSMEENKDLGNRPTETIIPNTYTTPTGKATPSMSDHTENVPTLIADGPTESIILNNSHQPTENDAITTDPTQSAEVQFTPQSSKDINAPADSTVSNNFAKSNENEESTKSSENKINPKENIDYYDDSTKSSETEAGPTSSENKSLKVVENNNSSKPSELEAPNASSEIVKTKNETSSKYEKGHGTNATKMLDQGSKSSKNASKDFEKTMEDTTNSFLNNDLMKKIKSINKMQEQFIDKHKTTSYDPYATFKRSNLPTTSKDKLKALASSNRHKHRF